MSKLIVMCLAMIGGYYLINSYYPDLWSNGFVFGNKTIAWGLIALVVVGFFAFRAKLQHNGQG